MLACGWLARAGAYSPAVLARKLAVFASSWPGTPGLCQAAGGFESGERFADGSHIVDANNLNALHSQTQGRADVRVGSVGFLVADELSQETLARVPDENRATERVELAAMAHQRNVMFVGFAETDSGVEANALARNSSGNQRIATLT